MRLHIDLLEQIAAPENLLSAWRVVRGNIPAYRRQRSAGPDGISLVDYERDLDAELTVLRELLLSGRYQPISPAYFPIPKKNGGQRMLAILPVQDRVAQRAVLQMLEPFWEHEFLPCSFGFRPGMSVEQAVHYVSTLRRKQEHQWVVDGDIQQCFDNLDHDLLMQRVQEKIADKRVLALLQNWLDVGLMQAGPPSSAETAWIKQAKTAGASVKRGWNWLVDALVQESDPFARYNYGGSSVADDLVEDRYQAEEMRQTALKRVAASGMMFGASLLRPTVRRLTALSEISFKSPAGRRLMKRGVLATSGFAGLAAAAAVTSYFINQRVSSAPVGVLQGSPLSPLLANIYLHPFDMSLLSAGHKLARFADDWVILCEDQHSAECAYQDAISNLDALNLKVNLSKTRILPPNEKLEWLGKVIV